MNKGLFEGFEYGILSYEHKIISRIISGKLREASSLAERLPTDRRTHFCREIELKALQLSKASKRRHPKNKKNKKNKRASSDQLSML